MIIERMEFTSEEWQGPLIMQEKEDCCLCLSFSNKAFRIINKLDVCA